MYNFEYFKGLYYQIKEFIKKINFNLKLNYKKIKLVCYRTFLKIKELNLNFIKNLNSYWDFLRINKEDDFIYLLYLLKLKLSKMRDEWNTAEHEYYLDEKEKLEELISLLDRMIEIALENEKVEKNEEYQKLSKSFFNKLHRLHDKLYK